MASIRSTLKKGLTSTPQFLLIPNLIPIQRSFCHKPLNPSTLLARLIHEPSSRIKSALDSEDISALKGSGSSWEFLVASLRSSSPQKAQLVIVIVTFFLSLLLFLTVRSMRKCGISKESEEICVIRIMGSKFLVSLYRCHRVIILSCFFYAIKWNI